MDDTAIRERLIQALSRSDDSTRTERADRIEWLAQHDSRPSAFAGAVDTLRLMEEARACFVCGHFVAALLLVTSFIEHTLADELQELGLAKGDPPLGRLIALARDHLSLPGDLLDRADRLRKLRNPFTHRRSGEDPDTLGNRFRSAKTHPATIMENDAMLALGVMYELFQLTLRGA